MILSKLLRALTVAVVASLAIGGAPPAQAENCAANDYICQALVQAKQQQQQTQAALDQVQHQLTNIQQQVDLLTKTIAKIESQIQTQQAAIDQTTNAINELEREIRMTGADIVRREADLHIREQLLDDRVRAMDKQGSVRYLALVVTATNFNQLVDRVLAMQQIVAADRRLLDSLQVERGQVTTLQDTQKAKVEQENVLLGEQQQQKALLQQSQAQEQQALAVQQQLEDQYRAQAEQLQAQEEAIGQQVQQLQQDYQNEATGAGGGSGRFSWPEGSRYISQGFGCSPLVLEPYSPSCPTHHYHSGIDIAGPYGTPIFASDTGVVTFYSVGYGYGNYAVIVHGHGWSTLYGHMAGFALPSGALVGRGQTIGYEGSTGWSTGPHLHFEIRYNNVPQDPCAYLSC